MAVASFQNARSPSVEEPEEPFPLMQLNNELLAGVAQHISEGTRRVLECVNKRAAAVTRAHGYIRRHYLSIELDVDMAQQPMFIICGLGVCPHEAPAAVRWRLARRRRVTHLRLCVSDEYDSGCLERAREPLVAVLDILLGSGRLRLAAVLIYARFGRGSDDVVTLVARLVRRHVATIVDVRLVPCADDNGHAHEHAHAELCQAVAACNRMQSFYVCDGDGGCLNTAHRHFLSSFSQLRQLSFGADSFLEFDALPRPSKLEELVMRRGWRVPAGLTDTLLQTRPDVFASLRILRMDHVSSDLPRGFLEASPRLQSLTVNVYNFVRTPPVFACEPLSYARSLVGEFFAASGGRRLRIQFQVALQDQFVGDDPSWKLASFESLCAKLLSNLHAAAPDVAIACSDAKAVVLGCGDILKAAVDDDPTVAAVVGRAFIDSLQSNGADTWLCAAVFDAATDAAPDYAAAATFRSAVVQAMGVRVRLDTELADADGVVCRLTRGDGDNKRQLDVAVSWFHF